MIATDYRRISNAVRWRLRAAQLEGRALPTRIAAWSAFQTARKYYRLIDEVTLRGTRKSDTVFIFGSGASLNAISALEWAAIEAHDTIGFNWFVRQTFVRCDYQFIREIGASDAKPSQWRRDLAEYFDLIRRNPRFADAVFLVQTGFRAINGNRAIGYRHLPTKNPVFLWRSLRDRDEPSTSLREGLTHRQGTLTECVNFAALLGWRRIVLTGVDLYDRRYFWLPDDQPKEGDRTVQGVHATAQAGLVEGLGRWRARFAAMGIQMYAYNPHSLLVPTLPVWSWSEPSGGTT